MAEIGERRHATAPSPARDRPERRARGPVSARDAAERAAENLLDLVRQPLEGVSCVRRGDDGGWVVCVDVLEVARIPDTTSLLATYEVELDSAGRLAQYRRTARYRRGSADR